MNDYVAECAKAHYASKLWGAKRYLSAQLMEQRSLHPIAVPARRQQQWQLPARAEEQKKQERRANNSTSQRVDSGADTIREQSNETPRNIRFFVATGIAATLITPT